MGTKKNKRKALYWYKKAAKNGDVAAYTNIALYYSSLGNFEKAKQWYVNALKKGCKDAALGLAKLGIENKINITHTEILEYLKIVIEAEAMVDVYEADQEEAYLLLERLNCASW